MPTIPPNAPLLSRASRSMLWISAGGGTSLTVAGVARMRAEPPDADGTSVGRRDIAETKDYFSGINSPGTIIPLLGALLCVTSLYGKQRLLMRDPDVVMDPLLSKILLKNQYELPKDEGRRVQALYFLGGGGFFGGQAAEPIIFHDVDYETRRFPRGSDPTVGPGGD